jgi:hypothetical protein
LLCSQCQRQDQRLYRVPDRDREGPRAPTAVCYFCFLRLVGRKPTKRDVAEGP